MKNIDYGIYEHNLAARSVINSKIRIAERDRNKYNVGLIRNIEEEIGIPAADYRDGSDTGSEMENQITHNNLTE